MKMRNHLESKNDFLSQILSQFLSNFYFNFNFNVLIVALFSGEQVLFLYTIKRSGL